VSKPENKSGRQALVKRRSTEVKLPARGTPAENYAAKNKAIDAELKRRVNDPKYWRDDDSRWKALVKRNSLVGGTKRTPADAKFVDADAETQRAMLKINPNPMKPSVWPYGKK